MSRSNQTVVIKRVKKAGHAHHGGAWKIAYADFVTAMMAFFLLMWLIAMTTPEQKEGLASYFAPPNISPSTSGSGGILGGRAMDESGAQTSSTHSDRSAGSSDAQDALSETDQDSAEHEAMRSETSLMDLASSDPRLFHSAAASIRQAWQALPEITEIADRLIVEVTDEGLDIQIIEQRGRPMFEEGSKYPLEWTRGAIASLAPILQRLPNQVRISGHTAAGTIFTDPRYGAWELSSDRANVVRGLLGEFGLADNRVHSVVGKAASEPYFVNDPYLAANERIRITVLNAPSPFPLDMAL